MKIAFIGQKGMPFRFGGVEKHVEDLAVRLAAAGHEVLVYTRPNYTDPSLRRHRGVKLVSLRSIHTKNLDAISHTFRACLDAAKRDLDLVHFHSIGPSSLIWFFKLLRPKVPVIATYHAQCYTHQKWGAPAKAYLKFGELIACTLADKTIAVSHNLETYAKEVYGNPVTYIPNGVAVNRASGADKIGRWGLRSGSYIVAVSRLVRHKGLHYLIEAFKNLKTDKKLVIVGDGAFTDDYVKEIKESAAENGRIVFTGNQTGDTLDQLFTNAALFVQPSESEGLSIALLEAMAHALPVLVSDIPENREAVGAGSFLFKSKSEKDLEEKLDFLLSNPEIARLSGEVNRRRVEANYNWDTIIEDILKIYREALKEKAENKKRFSRLRLLGRFVSFLI